MFFFYSLSKFERQSFGFLSTNFQRSGQNCILSVHTNTFRWNCFSRKKYVLFQMISINWVKFFLFLAKIFQWVCPHCILSVYRNIARENFFSRNLFLWSFSDNERYVFGVLLTLFGSVVNIAIFAYMWKEFEQKQLFPENHNSSCFGIFREVN